MMATTLGLAAEMPALPDARARAPGGDAEPLEGDFVWDIYAPACQPDLASTGWPGALGAHARLAAPLLDDDTLIDLEDIDDSSSRGSFRGNRSSSDEEDWDDDPKAWVDVLD